MSLKQRSLRRCGAAAVVTATVLTTHQSFSAFNIKARAFSLFLDFGMRPRITHKALRLGKGADTSTLAFGHILSCFFIKETGIRFLISPILKQKMKVLLRLVRLRFVG